MAKRQHMSGAGPSQRQRRVGELIRRALAEILARGDSHDEDLAGVSVTVGEVTTTPDLKMATVFVLPLGGIDVDRVIAGLNREKGELRRAVTRKVSLKYSPDLKFVADTSFDRMDATRALFDRDDVRRDLDPSGEDSGQDPDTAPKTPDDPEN